MGLTARGSDKSFHVCTTDCLVPPGSYFFSVFVLVLHFSVVWLLISTVDLNRFRITVEKQLGLCPWRCFQKGLTKVGRPMMKVCECRQCYTLALVPGLNKRRKKVSTNIHYSLLLDCGCHVTRCFKPQWPCLILELWVRTLHPRTLSQNKPFLL